MTSPVVIKVGGALIDDTAAAKNLFANIAQLQSTRPVCLVHGGGPLVESLMADLSLASEKIDGLRVTPDEHMPYVCGALAGTANKQLTAAALATGLVPVGLSLIDGDMVSCTAIDEKYGAVGQTQANNPTVLQSLLASGVLPVFSSIGSSRQGRLLNVNADQAATAIAQLLDADLLLLSNVPGVLDGSKNLVAELNGTTSESLKQDGVITDGMAVKVDAAFDAANTLKRPVTIASWAASLTDIVSHTTGTLIIPNT